MLRPGSSRAIPSAITLFKTDLPALYEEVTDAVATDLAQHKAPIAWMTDGWTAPYSASSYAMTSVAFSDGKQLRRVCIGVQPIPAQHSAENLAKLLDEVLKRFKIDTRAWIGVTDTAAVMKALALKEMKHCWMPCISHVLNLVIEDAVEALSSVDEYLQQITEVARFFLQSSIATMHLEAAIGRTSELITARLSVCSPTRGTDKQLPRKLKLRAPTRWNSVVDMLRRFYVLAPAVIAALEEPMVQQFSLSLSLIL